MWGEAQAELQQAVKSGNKGGRPSKEETAPHVAYRYGVIMAKTLNHYSQQIKSLAPDALALDRAKQLGDLLLQAKAAVKAAGKLWTDWLQSDCDLTVRTAQRFMTIAKRWNEQAFTDARAANPSLAIREADKVLASTSTRKRKEEAPDPYSLAMGKLAVAQWEIQLASEIKQVDQWAGAELQAAAEAIAAAKRAICKARWGEKLTDACASSFTPSACRVEMVVGDRCSCRAPSGTIDGTITAVHNGAADDWSTYSWQQDGTDKVVIVGWGYIGAASGITYSIAGPTATANT